MDYLTSFSSFDFSSTGKVSKVTDFNFSKRPSKRSSSSLYRDFYSPVLILKFRQYVFGFGLTIELNGHGHLREKWSMDPYDSFRHIRLRMRKKAVHSVRLGWRAVQWFHLRDMKPVLFWPVFNQNETLFSF